MEGRVIMARWHGGRLLLWHLEGFKEGLKQAGAINSNQTNQY